MEGQLKDGGVFRVLPLVRTRVCVCVRSRSNDVISYCNQECLSLGGVLERLAGPLVLGGWKVQGFCPTFVVLDGVRLTSGGQRV